MKQSSIEWLYERLERMIPKSALYDIDKKHYFNQAKEMHKQEVIDAFWNGDNTDCLSEQNSKEFAEQYYNETYNIKGTLPTI